MRFSYFAFSWFCGLLAGYVYHVLLITQSPSNLAQTNCGYEKYNLQIEWSILAKLHMAFCKKGSFRYAQDTVSPTRIAEVLKARVEEDDDNVRILYVDSGGHEFPTM